MIVTPRHGDDQPVHRLFTRSGGGRAEIPAGEWPAPGPEAAGLPQLARTGPPGRPRGRLREHDQPMPAARAAGNGAA